MKNVKLFLKSLFSNNACIEGGRHKPWYAALIIFFLSMIVSIVPFFVQTIKKNGSDFVKNNTYAYEVGAQRFAETLDEKDLKFEVRAYEGEKYLDVDEEAWNNAFEATVEVATHTYHVYQHQNSDGWVDFEVYYVSDFTNANLNEIISSNKGVDEKTGETKWNKRSTTFIALGKEQFLSYQYALGNTSPQGNVIGDYKNLDEGFELASLARVVSGEETLSVKAGNVNADNYLEYRNGVWSNWKVFFDKGYTYNKYQTTWKMTLLMFGVNAGITIFMGFMIWVLTRGKNNPYRIYTVFECQFIAAWCAVTPAILACGLGFLLTQFAQVIFPLLLGVRIMWLSMKSLRPAYGTSYNEPKKNDKVIDAKPVK